jgi:hypothetical protein
MPDFEPLPYRIRLGVTGHRKIPDPAALQAAIKQAIDSEVEKLFPVESRQAIARVRAAGTTAISYRVLTPLAEGADRITAKAVLDYPGARLDAVLPLTVADYLEDFETSESQQEFRDLLAKCRRPVFLRTRDIREDRHDPGDQAALRRDAYREVGQYVVDHCDVLIAIWDGLPSRGRGGTAEIVKYAEEQNRPVIRVWRDGFQLLNPGANNGLDATALYGIDRFNREPITAAQRDAYGRNLDRAYFETPETARDIPAGVREFVNRCLFPYYAHASILAKENQKRFYRAGKFIYVLSAAAVGCAALGVLFPAIAGAAFSVELLLLLAIVLTLRQARRKHAHQEWIENRFLAERIRCGIFMAICGVDPMPIEVLPYMGHSQTVNDWTVRVFDEIWDRLPPLTGCTGSQCLILNPYVRDVWLGDQVNFHVRKKTREGNARKRLAGASEVVLPATMAAAAVHLLLLWLVTGPAQESVEWIDQVLAFIALLFPAIAASLAGMEAHREHLRLEKRSANMAPQLERLKKQMGSATEPERFETLLHQVDELMLRETQDWLMLMRYVEIKAG